jgi:predicted small secreted protein
MKRIIIALFAASLLVAAATGCHTVKGAGEDVESVGKSMQDSAQ